MHRTIRGPMRAAWLVLLCASCFSALYAADWDKLEVCRLVPDQYGDGDSFHVAQGDKQFIFRLYFVDCPETDDRFPDRVEEQAKYFGVSHKRALEIGDAATVFTRVTLAKPFTVWTKWLDARGASKLHRFYAIIVTDKGSLSSMLVRNGLSRIYGMPTALPDRMKAKTYIERLHGYEAQAKNEKKGGWK